MSDTVLGALIASISSLATLTVTEIFDCRKRKGEREYLHKKEFLAVKREKAEEVLRGIQIYSEILNEWITMIEYKNIDSPRISTEYIEKKFQGQKEKASINLALYFPKLDKKYLEYSNCAVNLNYLIANIMKARKYTSEEMKCLNSLHKKFMKSKLSLTDALVREIRDAHTPNNYSK